MNQQAATYHSQRDYLRIIAMTAFDVARARGYDAVATDECVVRELQRLHPDLSPAEALRFLSAARRYFRAG
jgi:hypothetical protein